MIKLHIVLTTVALLIMIAAGVQAIILALQDYLLKHEKRLFLLKSLPPLETAEKWLFRLILLGFIVLSVVLITSFIYFHPIFSSPLRQKTILTLVNWGVFAGLLLGRWHWGWRGRIAIRWTLAGVILLLIIYCSTGLLLHAS
jgi:ABC-type uncharacterized transport system permease subunit